MRDTLGRHCFSPKLEHEECTGCSSLYAERGRWNQAATLVSHIAVMLLVFAIACRPGHR